MPRSKEMDAARATGDPAPLLAAAALLPKSARAERALHLGLARILGADVTPDPAAVDAEGARWLAREHLARLETDAARPWVMRAGDGALRAWCDVLEGAYHGVPLEELRSDARAAGRSAEVVELTALEALACAQRGAFAEAERIARRGVRMAATEELPESAFLANLVLARLRRLGGRPHLTTHILATLSRYAPLAWRRWIDWERALAFGVGAPNEPRNAIERAIAGEVAEVPAVVREDLVALAALANPDVSSADPAVVAFRRGDAHEVPRGLHGLAAASLNGAVAWVAHCDDASPARLLSVGLHRLERQGFVMLPQSHRHRGRVDSLLAACALAGPGGLEEGALFRAGYGFAYHPALHGGPLGVSLHRARRRLADQATLERADGIVRIVGRAPLLLPDPRCAVGTEDRALQHIALGGVASARAIADALGVSLRGAQKALEALVREGLCGRERDGNAVLYRVEDTTFHEPTQAHARLGARGASPNAESADLGSPRA